VVGPTHLLLLLLILLLLLLLLDPTGRWRRQQQK